MQRVSASSAETSAPLSAEGEKQSNLLTRIMERVNGLNKWARAGLLLCLGAGATSIGFVSNPTAVHQAYLSARGLSPESLKADLEARGLECEVLVDAEQASGSVVFYDVKDTMHITPEEMTEIEQIMKALETHDFKLLVDDNVTGGELAAISAVKASIDGNKVMRDDIELGVRSKGEIDLLNDDLKESVETKNELEHDAGKIYGNTVTDFASKHGGVRELRLEEVSSQERHGLPVTLNLRAKNARENPAKSPTSQQFTFIVGTLEGRKIVQEAFGTPPKIHEPADISVLLVKPKDRAKVDHTRLANLR